MLKHIGLVSTNFSSFVNVGQEIISNLSNLTQNLNANYKYTFFKIEKMMLRLLNKTSE